MNLLEVFGNELGGKLNGIFDDIITTGQTVEEFEKKYPEEYSYIHDSFFSLERNRLRMPTMLFRASLKELYERALKGGDCRLPTQAEIMWILQETSLRSPLNAQGSVAYSIAVERLLPYLDEATPLMQEVANELKVRSGETTQEEIDAIFTKINRSLYIEERATPSRQLQLL